MLVCHTNQSLSGLKRTHVCVPPVQDGLIEDYYGHGHAHKLIVDLQESQAIRAFLEAP